MLWHAGLGSPPRLASVGATAYAARHRAELVDALGPDWPEELAPFVGDVAPSATVGSWGELVIHDAHAPGHSAVWLPASRVLLAGDMLSDIELPLAEQTGLVAYDAGLETLRPYAERAALVVTGHGSPTAAGAERWRADREYLDAVLAGRASDDERLARPGMAEADAANRALSA